ncbi:MAG: hypothetical protein IIZ25_01630 [Thermoguttaceae bacterium]|nr:hypothetical protein [Thermoguttaceae bacterium]
MGRHHRFNAFAKRSSPGNLRAGGLCVGAVLLFVWLLSPVPFFGLAAGVSQESRPDHEAVSDQNPAPEPTAFPKTEEQHLRYRYWMVPDGKIDQWPWGSEKYYPIPYEQFSALMDARTALPPGEEGEELPSSVKELRLRAIYRDGRLCDGQGEVFFSKKEYADNSDATQAHPRELIPFETLSFATGALKWEDGTDATLGLYPNGRIYLSRTDGEHLSFEWSQQGTVNGTGEVIFELSFLPSPVTSLTVELPNDVKPMCDGALLLRHSGASKEAFQVWRLFPGTSEKARLTLVPVSETADLRNKTGYRQELDCRLAEEGTEIKSRFIFDGIGEPSDRLTLILDQPLVLKSAVWKHSDHPIDNLRPEGGFGTTTYQIPFPAKRPPEGLDLLVTAIAPSEPALAGQSTFQAQIPGVRLLSDALFWRETTLRLDVVRPLSVLSFDRNEMIQAFDRFTTSGEDQEGFVFKFFEPNASLAILLGKTEPSPIFSSAHQIQFDFQEIRSQSRLQLAGLYDRLEIPIADHWQIETVRGQEGLPLNWVVRENEKGRELILSLRHAAAEAKTDTEDRETSEQATNFPVIEMVGRYTGEISERLPVDSLVPIDVSKQPFGDHLISFSVPAQYRVRWFDPAGRPMEPRRCDEALTRSLFSNPQSGLALRIGNDTSAVSVEFVREEPSFQGEAHGTITVRNDYVTEQWRFRVTPPASGRVDQVLIAFHHSDAGVFGSTWDETEWEWNLAGESEHAFQVTHLSEEDRYALGLGVHAHVWEFRPLTSRSAAFEILAVRSHPLRDDEPFPLPSFLRTDQQVGEIVIAAEETSQINLNPVNLRSIPVPLPKAGEYETALGAFSYDPNRLDENREPSYITLSGNKESPPRKAAWCWFMRLDTLLEPDQTARNYLSVFLENAGKKDLCVTLPTGITTDSIQEVRINGERATWYPESDGAALFSEASGQNHPDTKKGNSLSVLLPDRERYVTFCLIYSHPCPALEIYQKVTPRVPQLDIEVLSGDWNVWIPPEYAARQTNISGWHALLRELPDPKTIGQWFVDHSPLSGSAVGNAERIETIRKRSDYFFRQLGNSDFYTQCVSIKKARATSQALSSENASDLASGGTSQQPVTWGDLLATPEILRLLFPENVPQIVVNRAAMGKGRILPTTEVTPSDNVTGTARALEMTEPWGLVFIFLTPDLVYVTTNQERQELGTDLVPLGNDRVWTVRNTPNIRELIRNIETGSSPQRISAKSWNEETMGSVTPWKTDPFSIGFPIVAQGWRQFCVTLDEAAEGIDIINQPQMAIWKWLFFLATVVLTWRGPLSTRPFLIFLFGGTLSVFHYLSPLGMTIAVGVLLGALYSLCIGCFRPAEKREKVPVTAEAEVEESEVGYVKSQYIPERLPTEERRLLGIRKEDKTAGGSTAGDSPNDDAPTVVTAGLRQEDDDDVTKVTVLPAEEKQRHSEDQKADSTKIRKDLLLTEGSEHGGESDSPAGANTPLP